MSGPDAPRVIGIAGPSASGKTSLARAIAERLPGGGLVFELDSYYHDQRGVSDEAINVDVPEALDYPLILSDLKSLVGGRSIRQPIYDYAKHARSPIRRTVEPAPFVVVEGLYALYWPDVRGMMQTTVFIALDQEECLRRRVARDTAERGRTVAAATFQYEHKVRPMYDRHVFPTHQHATVILDGTLPLETLTQQLLAHLLLD